jgi:hypothetical protein
MQIYFYAVEHKKTLYIIYKVFKFKILSYEKLESVVKLRNIFRL